MNTVKELGQKAFGVMKEIPLATAGKALACASMLLGAIFIVVAGSNDATQEQTLVVEPEGALDPESSEQAVEQAVEEVVE